jgi:eukaryotic-like serine/threonine-protein kinase
MTIPGPERRLGTTVRDKWTLERILGVGGMAAVYVGLHRIGRRDALKILHPEAAKRKDVCQRFEREAKAVNSFRHPGVVEIRDIDVTEDGAPFLVMELLDGESLLDRVERLRTIPLADVLAYADQTLDVLAAAHPLGIIHRDIKPANLYLLRDGRLKVLDFGLARVLDPDGTNAWTQTGATLGTTPYMPPEQARGRHIDGRADLFAVGATMFRLLTGRRIHDAATDFDLLMKMAKEPAPPIASVLSGLPDDVCRVIDRALAFDRDRRYADAASMLADVRAVRARQRPLHALRFMEEEESVIDRAAMTLPRGRSAPPPAEASAVSVEIPVVWSVPMTSSLAPFVEIDLPSSLLVPDLDGSTDQDAPPLLTPRIAVNTAALEMTLLSPGGEPKKGE